MTWQEAPGAVPGHDQTGHRVRFEWGPTGATQVPADVAVVVDILSFTTTLGIAVEKGVEVFPFQWRDARAAEHALRHGATLAVGRFEALALRDARHVSLSPARMLEVEGVARLVLPSPNGSTIAFGLAESGSVVLGAGLRNATAVARHAASYVARTGGSVVVIAAGERWPDDSLRPAVEDLWGAGAVIDALATAGVDDLTVEARVAADAWRAVREDVPAHLAGCASGQELVESGYGDDVAVAGHVDVAEVVPVLEGERFVVG